jgi:hypothetical protein
MLFIKFSYLSKKYIYIYNGVHLILVFMLKATLARALIKCLEAQFSFFFFKLVFDIAVFVAYGP